MPKKPSNKMSKEKLKMFVWEGDGVLTDYTNGMICVLAKDFEQALDLIYEKSPENKQNFPVNKYKIIEKPEAFVYHGCS